MTQPFFIALFIYLRTCITLEMTIKTKAINKGAIPTLTAMINLFTRLGAAAVDISFNTNSAINTKMPIRANEAASAGIIRDNTVEVVIVEVMIN